MTLFEKFIEIVQRATRLIGSYRITLDRQLIALGADIDPELLLDPRKVFIKLSVQRTGMFVVIEIQNDMRHVRRPGRRLLHVCCGAQAILPIDALST